MGIFDQYQAEAWPITFKCKIRVGLLSGGIPMDPAVVKSWCRSKLRDTRSDTEIAQIIAQTMADMGCSEDEAVDKAVEKGLLAGMNSFKFDDNGLFIEGRMVKAAVKEAVSCAAAADKIEMRGWGKTKKFLTNFLPEHVFVDEETLYIMRDGEHVKEPDGKNQKFIHTFRGDSIGYEHYVKNAEISFTVKTDYPFSKRDWAIIWLTGERQGVGASRSQGYGTYEVIEWECVEDKLADKKAAARKKASLAGSGMDEQALIDNGIRG